MISEKKIIQNLGSDFSLLYILNKIENLRRHKYAKTNKQDENILERQKG